MSRGGADAGGENSGMASLAYSTSCRVCFRSFARCANVTGSASPSAPKKGHEMLSREENDLLTRVGPGTPMGNLMRQYWQPALLSPELPQRDGPPIRVRLLGEDLVAFRDSQGRVGLLGALCPHRGAPLVLGRNEESGLRCIYHGWKFDTGGRCLEMPNVPVGGDYKDKVGATSYRCVERNGVIWAYMGPLAEPPVLPELEWSELPVEHRLITK